jgi:lipoprotein signal peptidase
MIGNYIGHFDDRGVIDFISTYYYYCNLADIFQWIGLILLMRQLYKHLVDQNRQAEEVL